MRKPCGTFSAYRRHKRDHELIDDACEAARLARAAPPRELRPCGTAAAYRRHIRHDEPPCDDCTAAERRRNPDADMPGSHVIDLRPRRNNLPGFVPYVWRDPARCSAARLAELAELDLLDELNELIEAVREQAPGWPERIAS